MNKVLKKTIHKMLGFNSFCVCKMLRASLVYKKAVKAIQ